ncbi:hypothetical protein BH10ACT1_BH10ACT1_19930 [soil metagenome]
MQHITDKVHNLTVSDDVHLQGQAIGRVTVYSGGHLTLDGQATDGVTIQQGGAVDVRGMVIGDIDNSGTLTVAGMVIGRVHTSAGASTTIHRGAVVNGVTH